MSRYFALAVLLLAAIPSFSQRLLTDTSTTNKHELGIALTQVLTLFNNSPVPDPLFDLHYRIKGKKAVFRTGGGLMLRFAENAEFAKFDLYLGYGKRKMLGNHLRWVYGIDWTFQALEATDADEFGLFEFELLDREDGVTFGLAPFTGIRYMPVPFFSLETTATYRAEIAIDTSSSGGEEMHTTFDPPLHIRAFVHF